MQYSRLIIVPIILALLFSAVFMLANPERVQGQLTIPTRTPVPPDNPDPPPDDDDDDGGNDGDNGNGNGGDNDGGSQPSPTDSAQPTATNAPVQTLAPATNTPPPASPTPGATSTADAQPTATIDLDSQIDQIAPGSTPVEFPILATAYPTAEPCGEPPTFTTLTTANVYAGPGSDYPVQETLADDEARPIVGRAANATWWLIQLDGKYQQGWISDKAGTVQGYIGNLPLIEAPTINGALPTPGEEWNPTPAPICTPTPTPTSDGAVISGEVVDYGDSSSDRINTTGETTADDDLAVDIAAAEEQRAEAAEAAAPLELDVPATTPTPNLLPIAGLVLIIAAIFVALFLRRNPGGSDSSS